MSEDTLLNIVPTRALIKNEKQQDFNAMVFESSHGVQASSNQHLRKQIHSEKASDEGNNLEFDMKRARFEVMKYGLSGSRPRNKKKAEVVMCVKLGAIAPKKPNKNYKDLLREKKTAKMLREQRARLQQLGKNQAGAASVKCRKLNNRKKKNAQDTGEISKHYGVINPKIGKRKRN